MHALQIGIGVGQPALKGFAASSGLLIAEMCNLLQLRLKVARPESLGGEQRFGEPKVNVDGDRWTWQIQLSELTGFSRGEHFQRLQGSEVVPNECLHCEKPSWP
jgi:hypothetical protein